MIEINNKIWFQLRGCLWSGCLRCGTPSCCGFCSELHLFKSIECIGQLNPFANWALMEAKNHKNYEVQKILNSILLPAIYTRLLNIWLHEPFDTAVLPLLSLRRILNPSWHTSLIFSQALEKLYEKELKKRGFSLNILTPWLLLPSSPQHKKSKMDRLKFAERPFYKPLIWSQTLLDPGHKKKLKNVIFLDDVLTSGATLTFLAQEYDKKFYRYQNEKLVFICYRTVADNAT